MTEFARRVLSGLPDVSNSGTANNYVVSQLNNNKTNKAGGKVDVVVNPRLSMFGRVGWRDVAIFDQPSIPLPSGGGGNATTYVENKQVAVGATYTPTGASLLEFRFGWSDTTAGKDPAALGTEGALQAYGISGLPTDARVAGGLPPQLITGYSDLGRQATNPQWQYPTVFNPKVNYSWLLGRHSMKSGYEYQRVLTEVQDVNPLYGRDQYAGQFTRPTGAAASNVYNLADFMFGLRSTYALSNILVAKLQQDMHFGYVQDDWRVNDRLTLNLGLRYEFATPWVEENNVLSNFDPATRSMVIAKDGSLKDRSTINPDTNNFAPRLGLAWTPLDKTVVRGGYGVSYVHFHRAGGGNVLPINGPQVINAVAVQTPTTPGFRTTQEGYPADFTDPTRFNPLAANITYMPEDYRSSRVQSWYGSVQRELRDGVLVDLAYVGNRADGMLLFANYNQAAPNNAAGTIALQDRRPIREFADITYAFNGGKSRYHAFQGKVDWRATRDLTLMTSLTLSQTKDNGAGSLENPNGNFPAPQDFRNMDADFGLSSYHQPYNSTTSLVWDLPFGRGRRFMGDAPLALDLLLGGWQVAGVNTVNAGDPVTLTYTPGPGLPGVGHPAGLPRRQQLPAERDRRRAGARRQPHGAELPESRRRRDSHRPESAVRQRRAQLGARAAVLGARRAGHQAGAHALAERRARTARRGLQRAEPQQFPGAQRQPQRERVRHHHLDLRPAHPAGRREALVLNPSRPGVCARPGRARRLRDFAAASGSMLGMPVAAHSSPHRHPHPRRPCPRSRRPALRHQRAGPSSSRPCCSPPKGWARSMRRWRSDAGRRPEALVPGRCPRPARLGGQPPPRRDPDLPEPRRARVPHGVGQGRGDHRPRRDREDVAAGVQALVPRRRRRPAAAARAVLALRRRVLRGQPTAASPPTSRTDVQRALMRTPPLTVRSFSSGPPLPSVVRSSRSRRPGTVHAAMSAADAAVLTVRTSSAAE